jgi:hypothetical protein
MTSNPTDQGRAPTVTRPLRGDGECRPTVRAGRESIGEKACRLLCSGAVWVEAVDPDGVVARVQGDHSNYVVAWNRRGPWQCSCAYMLPSCSHITAVKSITERRPS